VKPTLLSSALSSKYYTLITRNLITCQLCELLNYTNVRNTYLSH